MFNVYVKGFVGNLGTKILIEEKEKELVNFFSNTYVEKIKSNLMDGLNPSLFIDNKNDYYIYDKEEIKIGGFLAALWRICDRNKVGLNYELSKVPILQGTIEISNYFDINPYRLLTNNAEIIFVDEKNLFNENCFIKKIGGTNNTKQRIRTDIETKSFLIKSYKDELFSVINKKQYLSEI